MPIDYSSLYPYSVPTFDPNAMTDTLESPEDYDATRPRRRRISYDQPFSTPRAAAPATPQPLDSDTLKSPEVEQSASPYDPTPSPQPGQKAFPSTADQARQDAATARADIETYKQGQPAPPWWRQVLGGIAASTAARGFAPLIEYGPKGLAERQRQQRIGQMVQPEVGLAETGERLASTEETARQAREQRAWEQQQATDLKTQELERKKAEDQAKIDQAREIARGKFTDPSVGGKFLDPEDEIPEGYRVVPSVEGDPAGTRRAKPTPNELKRQQEEAKTAGWLVLDPEWAKKNVPGIKPTPSGEYKVPPTGYEQLMKAKPELQTEDQVRRDAQQVVPDPRDVDIYNRLFSRLMQTNRDGDPIGRREAIEQASAQVQAKRQQESEQGFQRGQRETKQSATDKQAVFKAYGPTLDSAERFNVMAKNLEDGISKGDQQAMLSLLANHLGMTIGLQKGRGITQAIIGEAVASRPWLQGMQSKFDKNGYLSGVTLTPDQMRQMVHLARERFREDYMKSVSEGNFLSGAGHEAPRRVSSKSVIRFYTTLAGGDANKAKQMAAEDGWSVE